MTDFVAALAKKWCPKHWGNEIAWRDYPCICDRLTSAITEALEEAEKMIIAARDLDGPHEGKQLDCACDLKIVTHLKAWNAACEHIAAAIRALREEETICGIGYSSGKRSYPLRHCEQPVGHDGPHRKVLRKGR